MRAGPFLKIHRRHHLRDFPQAPEIRNILHPTQLGTEGVIWHGGAEAPEIREGVLLHSAQLGTEGVNWADDARYERSADLDMKSMDETVKTEETREEWMDYPARSPYWWDHRRRKPRIPELNLSDGKWLDGMWGHLRGNVDVPKGISAAGAWDPHALTSDETK